MMIRSGPHLDPRLSPSEGKGVEHGEEPVVRAEGKVLEHGEEVGDVDVGRWQGSS